jgi:hypothetical protein
MGPLRTRRPKGDVEAVIQEDGNLANDEDRPSSEVLIDFLRNLLGGDETHEVPRGGGVGRRSLPSMTPFLVKRGR